jgi:rubredoxin
MCAYRCLLCGHAYVVARGQAGALSDDDFPDWSASDNSCPVCGGLALPSMQTGRTLSEPVVTRVTSLRDNPCHRQ